MSKLNDPTQSEQIIVRCSDEVGSFFACSLCVSEITGTDARAGEALLQNVSGTNVQAR